MTFIRRLTDSISIFTNPEQQPQDTTPTQSQTNFGVANTADLFEASASNNFDLLQQQIQSQSPIQETTPPEVTVDASSLFLAVDPNSSEPNSPRLQELKERLKAINERRSEIQRADLVNLKQESLELQKTAQEIRASAESDDALSDSVVATLDSLGILGLIGGLPVPQIALGILGSLGVVGLSEDYKHQMYRAAAELDKKAGLIELDAENLQSELQDLNKQAESVAALIKEEEQRLSQGFDDLRYSSNLIAQTPWQDFRQPEDLIKNNDSPSVFLLNSDIQKLTNEE